MKRANIWNILLRLSGIILLIIILLKVDTKHIFQQLSHINLIIVSPIFLLFLILSYLKTKRWEVLLVNSGVDIAGKNLFFIYAGSFLIGAITPGRIGEVLKYKLLMGKDSDNHVGLVLSVQDRLWDLSFTLLIGSCFLIYVLHDFLYLLFFLPGLCLFIVVSMYPESCMKYLGRVLSKVFPGSRLTKKVAMLSQNMVRLSSQNLAQCALFTIFSWLVYFSQVYFFFRATGVTYNFMFISCVVAAAGLLTLLPISIAGIGTRDMALVGLFSLSGRPPEAAIVLSACILAIFFANCLISLPFWMYASNSCAVSHAHWEHK